MTDSQRLHAALSHWAHGYNPSAEISVIELSMRYPSSAEQLSTVLYERAAGELTELLALDSAARFGDRKAPGESDDLLVHAALRLRHLQKGQGELGSGHPRTRSRIAATLRRLLAAAQDMLDELDIPKSLSDVDSELQAVEYGDLPPAQTAPPSRDGSTLADQFLLTCLPGKYPMTVHVRVFRPAERSPVLLLGELTDYHSPGLLETPEAWIRDLRKRLPALFDEHPILLHYLPIDYVGFSQRHLYQSLAQHKEATKHAAGMLDISDKDGPVSVKFISATGLLALVDGPVQNWHAADYNSASLTAWGIRTVDSIGGEDVAGRRIPMVLLRCRRWACGMGFDSPVRRLAEAKCPRCGSTKMQPIRVLEE